MSHFPVIVLVKAPGGHDPAIHRTPSHNGVLREAMERSAEAVGNEHALATFHARWAAAATAQAAVLEKRPKLIEEIEAEAGRLLAPYNENLKVPEYDKECCIGDVARREAREQADKTIGTIGQLRESFKAIKPYPEVIWAKTEEDAEKAEANDEAWERHVRPYKDAKKAFFESHPMREKPDPTCGFYTGERQGWWKPNAKEGDRYEDGCGCGGTGYYRSTYNPKSQWDWYSIGGRWDNNVPGNIAPVPEVLALEKFSCYAVVTPDGEWHQRGEMGWWGMSSGDKPKDEWAAELRVLLEANADCIAVGVDCHI